MNSTSIDSNKPWIANDHDRPAGMEIRLLKRTHALPWSQFVHADGSSDEIQITFATHEVVVKGAGLDALLTDCSNQRVSLLREPVRVERFAVATGPRITSISVRKVE